VAAWQGRLTEGLNQSVRASEAEEQLLLKEARDMVKRADESVKKVRALARGEYGELHVSG
jgi:hypothetical protein